MLLVLIYFCIGAFGGYFPSSLKILANSKNATFRQLATLQWIALPFSFKFLIAPFVDAFYIKRIGKRKTYVCLVLISMGIISIYYSFKI